jgi:aspartyl-tRNA(Asn)/glutamyl-tRNA(Gln) amidotransferase subunit A
LENVISPYDSTVVSRIKCRGLIPFGRANMDEFAMGSSCENSAFKKTANPWDLSRVPGGSSGGSAACVAAGEVPVSLGSDTGGSIRQPAAFCGVTGLKPTYGRVSRYGLVAFASSLDQIGPLGREVHDTAVMLDIIGGHDPLDSTSVPEECGGFANAVETAGSSGFEGLKIGIPEEYFNLESVSSGVKNCLNKSRKLLSSLGAELVPVSLPHTKYAVAVYYIIATAEASANLARFDGIRYGKRAGIKDLNGIYFKSRGEGFGDEVKRRIILGTYVLSSGYYDAYYLRAQKARTLIRKDFEKAFEKCNLLFTPATPAPAFKFGEKSDPLQMYLADVFTIALNLAGNCGISLPADIDDETGMPIGVQFIAPPFAEASMLKVAKTFESNRAIRSFVPDI